MIRLTLISSWAVLLLMACAPKYSGPYRNEYQDACFQAGGAFWSDRTGCIYKNPEIK